MTAQNMQSTTELSFDEAKAYLREVKNLYGNKLEKRKLSTVLKEWLRKKKA